MQDKAKVYVKIKLLGKNVPCLLDSGCEATLILKSLVDKFKRLEMCKSDTNVWAANDTPIRICAETRLPLHLDDHCLWTNALISEDVEEVMLGADWLQEHGCIWDFRAGTVTIDGRSAVTLTYRSYIRCRRVFAQVTREIPPRSQVDSVARRTLLTVKDCPENVIVETRQLKPGLYVGRTLLSEDHRNVKVSMTNTTHNCRNMHRASVASNSSIE